MTEKVYAVIMGLLWSLGTKDYIIKSRRKLPGEWISDFNFTYDMPRKILFLVTSIFRLALK